MAPGNLDISLTTPAGEACTTDLQSDDTWTDISVEAGKYSQENYYCM